MGKSHLFSWVRCGTCLVTCINSGSFFSFITRFLAVFYSGSHAPHHGSKFSSTSAFIQATSPVYVVFATGYRNPYGFSDEKVVSRYKEIGSYLVNTASQGMISFEFSNKNELQLQPGYRELRQRFWHSKI